MEGAAPGCNPVVSPALVSAGQEPRSRLRGGSRLGLERLRVLKGESFLNEQKKSSNDDAERPPSWSRFGERERDRLIWKEEDFSPLARCCAREATGG